MSQGYALPAAAEQVEYVVKKSRFIARVGPANDRAAAMAMLAQARADFPDARHHCWAYVIGDPYSPTLAACADDGEPSGTAGKPMLNVLQHKQVGDVMLIVIRYFGGIKLGAGGLVRAYSQAAQMAMERLALVQQTPKSCRQVIGPYGLEQPLRHFLGQCGGDLLSVDYGSQCIFSVQLPIVQLADFEAFIGAQGAEQLPVDEAAHCPHR